MRKVLIINPVLKQYRLKFFEKLYFALQRDNVQMKLVYADPKATELQKSDNVEIDARFGSKSKMNWFFGGRLGYHHILLEVFTSELIITVDNYKYLCTPLNLILCILKAKKMAFWGHGRNRQSNKNGFIEWIKLHTLNRSDWWFAYTEGVAKYLVAHGVPKGKITITQNSVDMEDFRENLAGITELELNRTRQQLGISSQAIVGLYCGSLYPEKQLPFLLEAARLIREAIPGFELVIIGDGEERGMIEDAAGENRWIHYPGPKFGPEKALYFKLAHSFLHPGAVGLAILDAFNAGLPMITTSVASHGPEIDYLENDVNGLVLPFDTRSYADGVITLLADETRLANIRKSAAQSAEKYSMDAMVENFRVGILKCLA